MGIIGIIGMVWLGLVLAGAVSYVIQRLSGALLPPNPVAAGGLERLGAARLVLGVGCLLGILLLMSLNAGLMGMLSWIFAALVLAGVLIATPPNVTIALSHWAGLALAATGVPLLLASQMQPTPFDGLLWLALCGVGVAWLAKTRWAAPGPLPLPAVAYMPQTSGTGSRHHSQTPAAQPTPSSASPRQLAAPTPIHQSPHLTLREPTERVIDIVGRCFVGQPQTLKAWSQLLVRHANLFSGLSTRPAVVIHAGPVGSGRATLVNDLANRFGCRVDRLEAGLDLTQVVRGPLVLLTNPDPLQQRQLADAAAQGDRWRNLLFVVRLDAPQLADLVDDTDQSRLRSAVSALLDPKLVAVATVVPFRLPEVQTLAAIAIRLLVEEGERVGVTVVRVDAAVAAEVATRIPDTMRDQGSAGMRHVISDFIGTVMDDARAIGCQRVTLHLHNKRLSSAPA